MYAGIAGNSSFMTDTPAWAHDVLRQQLAMNPQTWAAFQEHGVDESTKLRLEFFYLAPGQTEAEALGAFLRHETDYDVDVHSMKKGMLSKKQWSVTGTTQPTAVSLDILNQWVGWMVAAGVENGGCEFDGWGAEAP
jgi:hypothetical protein